MMSQLTYLPALRVDAIVPGSGFQMDVSWILPASNFRERFY